MQWAIPGDWSWFFPPLYCNRNVLDEYSSTPLFDPSVCPRRKLVTRLCFGQKRCTASLETAPVASDLRAKDIFMRAQKASAQLQALELSKLTSAMHKLQIYWKKLNFSSSHSWHLPSKYSTHILVTLVLDYYVSFRCAYLIPLRNNILLEAASIFSYVMSDKFPRFNFSSSSKKCQTAF